MERRLWNEQLLGKSRGRSRTNEARSVVYGRIFIAKRRFRLLVIGPRKAC